MVLTIVAERRNSPSSGRPSTSSCTVCVKFPFATAAIARVTSVVGRSKSSTSVLTETSISPHAALGRWKRMRSRVRPSFPTTCPTRFSSFAICWFAVTMSLNVSAIFPASPVQFPGKRTEKSPSRMVCRLARITLRSADTGSDSTAVTARPLLLAFGLGSGIAAVVALLGSLRFILLSTVQTSARRQFCGSWLNWPISHFNTQSL